MTDAEIQALYTQIVAAMGPCPGVVDPISQECSIAGCREGKVPLLPGLRDRCIQGNHLHRNILPPVAERTAANAHIVDSPCPGYWPKPLSLETLLEALENANGWNPLVNVGRTFTRDRWEAVVGGCQGLGATPLEALLRAIAGVIGVGHDRS